jgi:pimeloyl-ACP methyl ester carboxylesterase
LPAYFEQGTGTTAVLLLHGVGGGRAIWADAASGTATAIAAAGYRALALDFPGYGDSTGTPTLDAMVQAVLDLIVHAGATRTVLLGHSMGGMVAQELAARAPQMAQGLILACTSAAFGKPGGEWQDKFLAERLAPLDAGLGMAGMADLLVPGLVAPTAPASAREAARRVMAAVPEATYRVALKSIAGFDRREALPALRVPTLMLAAEADRTAPPDVMQRMAAKVRGAEYLCLSGAGHIANVEAPQAFNGAVVSFLQRHFS